MNTTTVLRAWLVRVLAVAAAFALPLVACGNKASDEAATRPPKPPNPKPQAEPARSIVIKPMAGPYASVGEFCTEVKHKARANAKSKDDMETVNEEHYCGPIRDIPTEYFMTEMPVEDSMRQVFTFAGPFFEAMFIGIEPYAPLDCRLAVRTKAGWFVATEEMFCASGDNRSQDSMSILELAMRDVLPGQSAEIIFRFARSEAYFNLDNDGLSMRNASEALVVCGIGASKKPSCTAPITTQYAHKVEPLEEGGKGARESLSFELKVSFEANAIVVSGDYAETASVSDPRGRYEVIFP